MLYMLAVGRRRRRRRGGRAKPTFRRALPIPVPIDSFSGQMRSVEAHFLVQGMVFLVRGEGDADAVLEVHVGCFFAAGGVGADGGAAEVAVDVEARGGVVVLLGGAVGLG